MKKVAIMTDSNSGMPQAEGKELGVHILPMPFFIDGEEYFEEVSLSQRRFYERLAHDAEIGTSQPTVGAVLEAWEGLLAEYEQVVHIPMSSGLSGSCATALSLAANYDGRVQVVNNQRVSVTQRQSVLDAISLAEQGKNAQQIKELLEKEKFESSIYITVDTLKYLKRGGRVTAAAAAIGTVLNIKPVLQIQGEKLDAFSKCRGMKQARKIMIDAMKKDLDVRFLGHVEKGLMCLEIAYTDAEELAEEFKRQVMEEIPGYEIAMYPLALSIACHIGPGALALACAKRCVG